MNMTSSNLATQAETALQNQQTCKKSTENASSENNDKNLRRQWQKPGQTFLHKLQNAALNVSTSTDTQTTNEESSNAGELDKLDLCKYDKSS